MSNVNHAYKHIFIHVPKVAGTSMESLECVGGNGHTPVRHLLRNPGREWASYFSWGFVRNPYDRMVAIYSACHQHYNNQASLPLRVIGSFPEFVAWASDPSTSDIAAEKFPHLLSQSYYLADRGLRYAVVDFVGRYETLEDDWRRVYRKLDFPPEAISLPRLNSTSHKSWREYYRGPEGHESRRQVYDLYADDFRIFNYDPIVDLPLKTYAPSS